MTDLNLVNRFVELATALVDQRHDPRAVADACIAAGLIQEQGLYGPLAVANRLRIASDSMAALADQRQSSDGQRNPQGPPTAH